ncbi:hypothetical protein DLI07_25850 [Vibrio parahaemolyticus]|nr:hypothetical protein [Vibrio parahaemolyticus]KIT31710.1 hypothetical protein H323_16455 [Vibrio parahaemolyticus VP766]KIT47718.1 hypothetical protein H334_12135 [Vibrio parahaemolyticus 901128]EGR2836903.1 hypothetical protein [Vibrio parahaemolyticus]EGR2943666.1 hypothetical protein [Vibrio parahaemolyticus]
MQTCIKEFRLKLIIILSPLIMFGCASKSTLQTGPTTEEHQDLKDNVAAITIQQNRLADEISEIKDQFEVIYKRLKVYEDKIYSK